MPLLGAILALWIVAHILAYPAMVIAPLIAIVSFGTGRFFHASVLMAIAVYAATMVDDTMIVPASSYETLIGIGLALEAVKCGVRLWWMAREQRLLSQEAEYLGNVYFQHVEDALNNREEELYKPPMKDVTPRPRALPRR